ncbi:MAG: bifunctional nuclease domain-containing protein [Polyangiaceae bacterium]
MIPPWPSSAGESRAYVDKIDDGIFYGTVVVVNAQSRFELDARSSDLIALAVGNQVPIHVAAAVFERAGIDLERAPRRSSAGASWLDKLPSWFHLTLLEARLRAPRRAKAAGATQGGCRGGDEATAGTGSRPGPAEPRRA